MLYFQGDVGIQKISDDIKNLPDNLCVVQPDNGRNILAYGEVTGHAHALDENKTSLYIANDNNKFYLVVHEKTLLTHEEHDPIELDEGIYEVIRQREYDDEHEWRLVTD